MAGPPPEQVVWGSLRECPRCHERLPEDALPLHLTVHRLHDQRAEQKTHLNKESRYNLRRRRPPAK